MNIKQSVVLKGILSALAGGGLSAAAVVADDLSPAREAVDQRAVTADHLEQAVKNGEFSILSYAGQGGAETCELIRPFLKEPGTVKIEAIKGLANCRDQDSFAEMSVLATQDDNPEVRIAALKALGFTTPEDRRTDHVALVVNVLDSPADDQEKAAALYGLMQNITYAGVSPAELPGLDISNLLHLASRPGALGFEAAYLLIRLQGLGSVLTPTDVAQTISADVSVGQKFLMARVMGQLGNGASDGLIELARRHASENLDDRRVAVSAVRALGGLSDQNSRQFLVGILAGAAPEFQQLALTALASRPDADQVTLRHIWSFVPADNDWLAVTAARSLVALGDDDITPILEDWLGGENYYRSFVALGLLNQSEVGKAILANYVSANPGTSRAQEVASVINPSSEGGGYARKTPAQTLVQSYKKRELVLDTSRGIVCIAPDEVAPYSAANFMLLADSGKMNNMVWHRVIPGFVAQAGQSEDQELANWGSIREEWAEVSHMPGTVGVATAGPDTGSAQFFVNLEHNRHLDGRYTVFGHVIKGMDAAYALQEGDIILEARTAKAPSAACE